MDANNDEHKLAEEPKKINIDVAENAPDEKDTEQGSASPLADSAPRWRAASP